ncbi:hypothetical protein GC163_19680 [bacterium]|nr:hypothetical protein [bacterium]
MSMVRILMGILLATGVVVGMADTTEASVRGESYSVSVTEGHEYYSDVFHFRGLLLGGVFTSDADSQGSWAQLPLGSKAALFAALYQTEVSGCCGDLVFIVGFQLEDRLYAAGFTDDFDTVIVIPG